MNKHSWLNNQLYIIGVMLCMACRHDAKDLAQPSCTLPVSVSFSQHIVPLFNAHCNTSGCHAGSQPAGNLNLEPAVAYAQLSRQGSGYLDTIHPSFSLLYAQMISVSEPMPPTGNLGHCETDLVLKWIGQRAQNN